MFQYLYRVLTVYSGKPRFGRERTLERAPTYTAGIWPLIPALLLGIVAGLRSMTAPAVISLAIQVGSLQLNATAFALFGNPIVAAGLSAGAGCEFFADTLPNTPNRTDAGPLIFRLLSGGLCGAALVSSGAAPVGQGVLAGCVGALIGAFGGIRLRIGLRKLSTWPDLWIALGEDAVALLLAALAISIN